MNRIVPFALALLAIAAFAACTGGTANPSGVASVGSQSPAPASSAEPEASVDPEDAALAFARCMREHGFDMPDPQFETGGMVMIGGPGEEGEGPKFDPQSEEFQAAEDACGDLLGEMRPGSGPSVQQDDGASGSGTGVQP